jgi:hypothetical protein
MKIKFGKRKGQSSSSARMPGWYGVQPFFRVQGNAGPPDMGGPR